MENIGEINGVSTAVVLLVCLILESDFNKHRGMLDRSSKF